ncbi:Protein FAR-RED IMPAIRED RESPONSE 1 [Linum grandiflorum]
MGGKAPKTIFTDQDRAMAPALKSEMPDTYHALCTFHILQNAKRNLSALFTKEFVKRLLYLFYNVDSEADFDHAWNLLIKECFPSGGRTGHKWLQYIHPYRQQWSSAWVKNHYTAGMVSTQLVESCNGIIRGFLSADKTIIDFFPHFDRMVESRRRAEREAEYHSRRSKPRNNFEYSELVNKAASEYTPKMFVIFQEQFSRIQQYHLEQVPEHSTEGEPVYLVYKHDGNARLDDRLVRARPQEGEVLCECKWWGTMGILCRHALTVMHILGRFGNSKFNTLPDIYISKRWTRGARIGFEDLRIARPLRRGEEEGERYVRFYAKFGAIIGATYRVDELNQLLDAAADNLALQVPN